MPTVIATGFPRGGEIIPAKSSFAKLQVDL
jgi:hypothetical protein